VSRVHLHADDHPQALAVLGEVLVARRHDPAGLAEIGYEPSGFGLWVDWERLEHSWLSSTERAAVVVARGIAAAERQGGWPPRIACVLVDAVRALGGLA
jgi:hypothetical protein